jgi:hypothetical protein
MTLSLGWQGIRGIHVRGVGAASAPGSDINARGPSAFDYAQGFLPNPAGMLEQAWGQLNQATTAGLSSEQQQIHALTLQKLGTALADLQEQANSFCREPGCLGSEPGFVDWRYKGIEPLTKQIRAELNKLVGLNQGSIVSQGYKGLLLGLTIAAVVAASGYFVWRKKSSRRG